MSYKINIDAMTDQALNELRQIMKQCDMKLLDSLLTVSGNNRNQGLVWPIFRTNKKTSETKLHGFAYCETDNQWCLIRLRESKKLSWTDAMELELILQIERKAKENGVVQPVGLLIGQLRISQYRD